MFSRSMTGLNFHTDILLVISKTLFRAHHNYIGLIAVSFQKETENSLISSILSGHYFVVCYGFLSPSWSGPRS